jgi:hypothetical protein
MLLLVAWDFEVLVCLINQHCASSSGGARNSSLCCHFKFVLSNAYFFTYFILFFASYILVYEGVSKIQCGQLTTQVLTWLCHWQVVLAFDHGSHLSLWRGFWRDATSRTLTSCLRSRQDLPRSRGYQFCLVTSYAFEGSDGVSEQRARKY